MKKNDEVSEMSAAAAAVALAVGLTLSADSPRRAELAKIKRLEARCELEEATKRLQRLWARLTQLERARDADVVRMQEYEDFVPAAPADSAN